MKRKINFIVEIGFNVQQWVVYIEINVKCARNGISGVHSFYNKLNISWRRHFRLHAALDSRRSFFAAYLLSRAYKVIVLPFAYRRASGRGDYFLRLLQLAIISSGN